MSKNQTPNSITKTIERNCLIYLLHGNDKTANIISNQSANGEIIIPRSINDESKEYIVKSILKDAFKSSTIKSIQFVEDSEFLTIEEDAILNSSIESFTIQSSLINLKERWCKGTEKLKEIKINQNNPYIQII